MIYRIVNMVSDKMIEPYLMDLVRLGRDFYGETTLKDKGLNAESLSLVETIKMLINSPHGILIVAVAETGHVVGTIAGIISPWMLCCDQLICQEAWWYVAEGHRGHEIESDLLLQFEEQAGAAGAEFCVMGTHDHPRERALLRYYDRKGYVTLEHLLIKKV